MKKFLLLTISLIAFTEFVFAQEDSLDVFRTPSKNSTNAVNSNSNNGKNALSISLAHLGRGGTMLTYERYINNTPFSVYAGLGVMSIDVIGQWSFQDELYLFDNEEASRTSVGLGRTVDLGLKYLFDREIGGDYIGVGYSSYSNVINLKVDRDFLLEPGESSAHKLNYNSRELKFVYGFINDAERTYYSDFNLGVGVRFLDYQILEVNATNANPYSSTSTWNNKTIITAEKKFQTNIKFWPFIGWKIGARF